MISKLGMANMDAKPAEGPLGSNFRPYQYEAFLGTDAVRILVLEPAEDSSSPLHGSIIQARRVEELARLRNQQSYSAMSYTWDEPNFCDRILLRRSSSSNASYDSYLAITPNVKVMLQQMRKRHKPRNLWIDAICLNQADDGEKQQQVPLMGEIYAQAEKVHIWLGSDDGDWTARVLAFLRLVALASEPVDVSKVVKTVFEDSDSAATLVARFFSHRWFFRRWILQEAALARYGIMHSGSLSIPYSLFSRACHRMQEMPGPLSGQTPYGAEMAVILSEDEKERNIFSLLWRLHQSDCSDKRDRIAALYGFLPRHKQLSLPYSSSYTEIYKQHARHLVQTPNQHELLLHLFHFGSISSQDRGGVSSWVPDWSNKRTSSHFVGFPNPSQPEFNSAALVPETISQWLLWLEQNGGSGTRTGFATENQLWRAWLYGGSNSPLIMFPRCRTRQVAPYTVFRARQNGNGEDILNVRWVNPWAGPYGRPVIRAVTQDLRPSTVEDVVRSLQPLLSGFEFDPKKKKSPHKDNFLFFVSLVEMIMTERQCPSLRHWGSYDRPIVVKQAMMLAFHEHVGLPVEDRDVEFSKSRLPLSETLNCVLMDLGNLLYEERSAFVELYHPSEPIDYAFGPSTLKRGTLLIPMASLLPDPGTDFKRVLWYQSIEQHRLVGPEGRLSHMAHPAGATTLVALEPLDSNLDVFSLVASALGGGWLGKARSAFFRGSGIAAVPPVRAKYVGACVAMVYEHANHVRWTQSPISRAFRTDVDVKHQAETDFCKWIKDQYEAADCERRPSPFCVDII